MQTFCIKLVVGLYVITTKPERVTVVINKSNPKTYETLGKAANKVLRLYELQGAVHGPNSAPRRN